MGAGTVAATVVLLALSLVAWLLHKSQSGLRGSLSRVIGRSRRKTDSARSGGGSESGALAGTGAGAPVLAASGGASGPSTLAVVGLANAVVGPLLAMRRRGTDAAHWSALAPAADDAEAGASDDCAHSCSGSSCAGGGEGGGGDGGSVASAGGSAAVAVAGGGDSASICSARAVVNGGADSSPLYQLPSARAAEGGGGIGAVGFVPGAPPLQQQFRPHSLPPPPGAMPGPPSLQYPPPPQQPASIAQMRAFVPAGSAWSKARGGTQYAQAHLQAQVQATSPRLQQPQPQHMYFDGSAAFSQQYAPPQQPFVPALPGGGVTYLTSGLPHPYAVVMTSARRLDEPPAQALPGGDELYQYHHHQQPQQHGHGYAEAGAVAPSSAAADARPPPPEPAAQLRQELEALAGVARQRYGSGGAVEVHRDAPMWAPVPAGTADGTAAPPVWATPPKRPPWPLADAPAVAAGALLPQPSPPDSVAWFSGAGVGGTGDGAGTAGPSPIRRDTSGGGGGVDTPLDSNATATDRPTSAFDQSGVTAANGTCSSSGPPTCGAATAVGGCSSGEISLQPATGGDVTDRLTAAGMVAVSTPPPLSERPPLAPLRGSGGDGKAASQSPLPSAVTAARRRTPPVVPPLALPTSPATAALAAAARPVASSGGASAAVGGGSAFTPTTGVVGGAGWPLSRYSPIHLQQQQQQQQFIAASAAGLPPTAPSPPPLLAPPVVPPLQLGGGGRGTPAAGGPAPRARPVSYGYPTPPLPVFTGSGGGGSSAAGGLVPLHFAPPPPDGSPRGGGAAPPTSGRGSPAASSSPPPPQQQLFLGTVGGRMSPPPPLQQGGQADTLALLAGGAGAGGGRFRYRAASITAGAGSPPPVPPLPPLQAPPLGPPLVGGTPSSPVPLGSAPPTSALAPSPGAVPSPLQPPFPPAASPSPTAAAAASGAPSPASPTAAAASPSLSTSPYEIAWPSIRLGRVIGQGAFGRVYRAKWRGTAVAVKTLSVAGGCLAPEVVADFRAEVAVLSLLRHPNILLFMGACTSAPHYAIVTALVPRGSVWSLLHDPQPQAQAQAAAAAADSNNKRASRRGAPAATAAGGGGGAAPAGGWAVPPPPERLDFRLVTRWALDVARGMAFLHSAAQPILHRDLKSGNLLVDEGWGIVISDFGLARVRIRLAAVVAVVAASADTSAMCNASLILLLCAPIPYTCSTGQGGVRDDERRGGHAGVDGAGGARQPAVHGARGRVLVRNCTVGARVTAVPLCGAVATADGGGGGVSGAVGLRSGGDAVVWRGELPPCKQCAQTCESVSTHSLHTRAAPARGRRCQRGRRRTFRRSCGGAGTPTRPRGRTSWRSLTRWRTCRRACSEAWRARRRAGRGGRHVDACRSRVRLHNAAARRRRCGNKQQQWHLRSAQRAPVSCPPLAATPQLGLRGAVRNRCWRVRRHWAVYSPAPQRGSAARRRGPSSSRAYLWQALCEVEGRLRVFAFLQVALAAVTR